MKHMKKKTSTFYELWQWRAWQGRRWTCREGHPNQRLWSDQNTDSATQHQTQDRSGHPTLIWGRGNASTVEALRIGVGVGSVAWVSDVDLLMVDQQWECEKESERVESCSGFSKKKRVILFLFWETKRERVIRVERVKYFYFKNFGYFNFSFFGWTCGGTFSTRRITIFDEVSFG